MRELIALTAGAQSSRQASLLPYCMAHQLWEESGERKLQTLAIRYYEKFVPEGDDWSFKERNLIIDWTDTRPSTARMGARSIGRIVSSWLPRV